MIANGGREKGNGLPQQEPSAQAEAAFLRKGREWSVPQSTAQGRLCHPTLLCPGEENFPEKRGEERRPLVWATQLFCQLFLLNEETPSLERNPTVTPIR